MFSAVRDSILPEASSSVPYDDILVDTVGGFDIAKSKYTIHKTGFFFIHLSAGVPMRSYLNYALQNASSSPNVLLTHTAFDGELVTSRNDIQYLNKGQVIYMSSDYPLYSDSMLQTSWSGFSLSDVMNTVVLFRAARASPYYDINSTVPLDNFLITISLTWDECNNKLVIPRSGIYFLTWSSASLPNEMHIIHLVINGIWHARTMIYGGLYAGYDVSSQSVILRLNEGDTVHLSLHYGPVYSDNNYQSSLTGFLYEPKHGLPIAWMFTFPDFVTFYGPVTLNFTVIDLDEGNVWNSSSASVRIPRNGFYFLSMSGLSWPVEYKFNMVLLVNGQLMMNVMEKIDTVRNNYYNLRSRSLIKYLRETDELVVSIPNGYSGYNHYRQLSFSGFLIQPAE